MSFESTCIDVLNGHTLSHGSTRELGHDERLLRRVGPLPEQLVFEEDIYTARLHDSVLQPGEQVYDGITFTQVPMGKVVIKKLQEKHAIYTDWLMSCTGVGLRMKPVVPLQVDSYYYALSHFISNPISHTEALVAALSQIFTVEEMAISVREESYPVTKSEIARYARQWRNLRERNVIYDVRNFSTAGGMVVTAKGGMFMYGDKQPY